MATPVPEKLWVKIFFYPAAILFGGGTLLVWAFMHLVALNFACGCSPVPFVQFDLSSRIFGAIIVGAPLLAADWFVWHQWIKYRREAKWAAAYHEKNLPDYARRKGYK